MGTHPIFESDFDCLTEWLRKYTEPTTPLCASTWPPTDRTTCPRTPDSSTPTICENAGSTTPTSTDAPMSANTLEKILKFAVTSVTTSCKFALLLLLRNGTNNVLIRFSHLQSIPVTSKTQLSGSQARSLEDPVRGRSKARSRVPRIFRRPKI